MMVTATTIATTAAITATVAAMVITAMAAVATKVSQTLQGCEDHTATVITRPQQ
jgi:hypothetical protein